MHILELDSFKLSDAVKFHNRLNPKIWGKDEQLLPEVREKLLAIADDFREFLGIADLDIQDITVSGSNAAYSYTPNSDIDLHLVVKFPEKNDVYQELFNAKKYQYNDEHSLTLGNIPVELYVQDADEPPVSQGEYSVKNNQWIQVPRRKRAKIDDTCVRAKVEDLDARIHDAIASGNVERMDKLWGKIKNMRQTGLDEHGEFGCENIAFKILRTNGCIKELRDARTAARDRELSLAEQNKVKKPFVYGYKSVAEDATMSPDGVSPETKMFLSEKDTPNHTEIIFDFMRFVVHELKLHNVPTLKIKKDPQWSVIHKSFGRYRDDLGQIELAVGNRHIMDVLRTLAHELQHRKQDEREHMPPGAGETGSPYENEAHAVAGVLMRKYADMHPEYFQDIPVSESASGYIPTKKQANDPRYSMALTVDIKPGQVGKEANKMALQTDKQGKPALVMKASNQLAESLAKELSSFAKPKSYGYNSTPLSQVPGEREDDLGNQEATGPEFPPQMPAGTTKIDVSDLTDWYRLGMDISDMDDADPEDYNQGPPQTVIVFPSDEAEQGYLKQFKRLGLKTHDMDPDVKGGEDVTGKHLRNKLAEELELFEEELMEIKMTSKNLSKLASEIPGVTVGLEFEMIVPNVDASEEQDMEPDYDQDERVRDIDDAVNFFDDGDYNSRGDIRRLRDNMLEDFHQWQYEKIDEDWDNNGFEFFTEYLDREDPFDPSDFEEQADEEIRSANPELDPESDEFQELKSQRLREIESNYYTETWEAQGRSYDYAREAFEEEKRDAGDYDESAWLNDIGIHTMQDVESNYGHVQWPHYTSYSEENETDTKEVALNFMNYMGYDTIAVGSYHGYNGGYELWNGSKWVKIGSNKPLDCFTIEPDGSLEGSNSGDTGLEFVSPPIPLKDIGTVMKKVQQWAGDNGVYTGKQNSTSMHTNISIPGYDLDKLDYLKAAILLGDEHVLRQFDRIGNTYARPAINKVKDLVKQKPEKAKELLDKMKSHLDAAASKLIHSGVTDKYTSINTKDNRIEYRSPGGDYLSDIADDPQKMIDTINRMVVNIDAAMDPNKYKEEYQKKLYKILTGQEGGREAKTGAKQDTPKDTKDLLNIFSRYAAGELPKAALKSFVRQAQLERKVARQKDEGVKMWWNVARDGQRMEVVATNEMDAKLTAAKEWGIVASDANLSSMTVKPLRPYDDTAGGPQVVAQQSTTPVWGIWDFQRGGFVNSRGGVGDGQGRLIGADTYEAARNAARNNGLLDRLEGGEFEIRQIPQQQPAQTGGGLYKIYDTRGTLIAGDEYGSDQEALERAKYWALRRTLDVIVKNAQGQEIGRVSNDGVITPTAQQPARRATRWEIVNNRTGDVVQVFTGGMEDEATDYAMNNYGTRFNFTTRPSDGEIQRVGTQIPNYYIKSRDTDEIVKAFFADDSDSAHAYLTQWKRDNNVSDSDYVYGRVSALPDAVQRNIVGNQPAPAAPSQTPSAQQGNWGIWIDGASRFAREPGEYPAGQEVPLRRFPSRQAAEQFLTITREANPRMRMDVEVREIEPAQALPDIFPDLPRPQAAQPSGEFRSTENVPREGQPRNLVPTGPGPWEIYRISNGETVRPLARTSRPAAEEEARSALGLRGEAPELYGVRTRQSSPQYSTQFGAARGAPNWELVRDRDQVVVHRIFANNQDDAIGQASDFTRMQGWDPNQYTLQAADAAQGGLIDVAGEQPTGGSFTGEWKVVDAQGREVYRFSGVGNNQGDANNVAIRWLRDNPRYMVPGVEVLPVMG